jgi:hypothetical protein
MMKTRVLLVLLCLASVASTAFADDVSPRVCFSTPAQAYLDTQTGMYYRSPPDGYPQYLDCAAFSAQQEEQPVPPPPPVYYANPPEVYYTPGNARVGGGGYDRNHDQYHDREAAHGHDGGHSRGTGVFGTAPVTPHDR